MTDRNDALRLLRDATGNPNVDFRQGQWEAIDAVANRQKRLLLVQRTGWGKAKSTLSLLEFSGIVDADQP